jgi:hypothetical protein
MAVMTRQTSSLTLACIVVVAITVHTQGPANFAGRWIPVDVPTAASLFAVGLTDLPGSGMTISQDAKTFTITQGRPNAELTKTFLLDGSESRNTWGLGTIQVSKAEWVGSNLVVTTKGPSLQWTNTYSMNGDQLKIEMSGSENTAVLFYKKVQ